MCLYVHSISTHCSGTHTHRCQQKRCPRYGYPAGWSPQEVDIQPLDHSSYGKKGPHIPRSGVKTPWPFPQLRFLFQLWPSVDPLWLNLGLTMPKALGWNGKTSKKDQKGQVLGCSLVEICTAMEHGRFLNKKKLFFHSYVNLPDGRIQCNWAVSKKLVGWWLYGVELPRLYHIEWAGNSQDL